MGRSVEFTVPGDAGDLTANQRLHWRERARRVQWWREQARLRWWQSGRPAFAGKVRISYTVRRGRRLDADNCAGSSALKAVTDTLVACGALQGDGTQWVEYAPVQQETGKQWRERPEVIILVEEMEP
jgi:uncharacterized protein YbjT (DUF2867 family)